MSVTLFVEGGGSSKALKAELRRGFTNLMVSPHLLTVRTEEPNA